MDGCLFVCIWIVDSSMLNRATSVFEVIKVMLLSVLLVLVHVFRTQENKIKDEPISEPVWNSPKTHNILSKV